MHFRKSKPRFDQTANELNRFKLHVGAIPCPACTQSTLQVDKLEVGSKGWSAEISCTNCNFKGTSNSTGFSFIAVSSKGKAVKPVKKEKP